MQSGYTGISYPFRINAQGGVAMSSTNKYEVPHIDESIEQIVSTNPLERVMESGFCSKILTSLFEPNDETLHMVIKKQITDAIRALDKRVSLSESDISLSVKTDDEGIEFLYATITYKVIRYQTYYETTVNLGELKK